MTVKHYYVAPVEFECHENPVTLGDNKFLHTMEHDGEILGIGGCILNAGTGAGTATQIQVRNATLTRDYYSTLPEFRVDDKLANNRAVLASNGVLATHTTFRQGDELVLDIDGLPGGADSHSAHVWLICGFWRTV